MSEMQFSQALIIVLLVALFAGSAAAQAQKWPAKPIRMLVGFATGASTDVVARILAGENLGTMFAAVPQRLSARKHWIAYTLRPRGAILVDRGAAEAICTKQRSILAIGVLGVRGGFLPGDSISIVDPDGNEIARGLSRLSAGDAARIAGTKREENDEVVHRDDLVVLPSE